MSFPTWETLWFSFPSLNHYYFPNRSFHVLYVSAFQVTTILSTLSVFEKECKWNLLLVSNVDISLWLDNQLTYSVVLKSSMLSAPSNFMTLYRKLAAQFLFSNTLTRRPEFMSDTWICLQAPTISWFYIRENIVYLFSSLPSLS